MERGWQVIAPIGGAEKYARIQRHAAGQQDRGGGRKNSRGRQQQDKENAAGAAGEVPDFRKYLLYTFLMKAQADNETMKNAIGISIK